VSAILQIVAMLIIACVTIGLPFLMVAGWFTWVRKKQSVTVSSILSAIGFTLGSVSVVLATSTVLYAHTIRGFPYYDPMLLGIYRTGFMLSFLALGCSFGGFWYPSVVRRHALVLSGGMLLFWIFAALSE
jgi:hypothetical protein